MPKTRSSDTLTWEGLADSYELWLADYGVIKVLVLRILRQKLGRGSAACDVALREAYEALKGVAKAFGDAAMEEGAEVDAGREPMEEGVATAVLRWLGLMSQIPDVFRQLSDVEQEAVTWDNFDVINYEWDTLAEIPEVPSAPKRVRIEEVEIVDDARDRDVELDDEGSEETPQPTKRARQAQSGEGKLKPSGRKAQPGPEAAQKVSDFYGLDRPNFLSLFSVLAVPIMG